MAFTAAFPPSPGILRDKAFDVYQRSKYEWVNYYRMFASISKAS